ncbi:MAG: hypothetical protein VX938_05020, partial [Myxococcota bacterium]|nr:hypothetical protein [Myxococcota bacterium]
EVRIQGPDGGPGIGLEWGSAGGDDVPAYKKGALYRSSYRRGPGLWDIDEAATPEEVRRRAMAGCAALAGLSEGPELTLRVTESGGAERDEDLEGLANSLRIAVSADLGTSRMPGSTGWSLDEVRLYQRWAPVVEVLLRGHGRTLGFIVCPTDEEHPAFRRTASYDLVYYSDDLAPSEHDELYLRDRETIEGFSLWLRVWDQG